MTVDEMINFLSEHPLRRDYEVIIHDKEIDDHSQIYSDSLDWDVSGKRIIINYG